MLFLVLVQSVLGNSLEGLLDVDGLLCGGFKVGNVALGLTPGHCAFLGDLPLVLLHINLIAQYNKGEVLWVPGAGLDEEFVPPTVQGLERLGAVYVINEDTAVRTTVERDTEGLESFLTSSIPQLSITGSILDQYISRRSRSRGTQDPHLHRNQPVINHDFLRQAKDDLKLVDLARDAEGDEGRTSRLRWSPCTGC